MLKLDAAEYLSRLKKDETYINELFSILNLNLRNDPELIKEISIDIIKLAKENNYNTAYAWAKLLLGWYYVDKSNLDISYEYFTTAYDIFVETDNNDGMAYTCNGFMAYYLMNCFYDLAIEWGLKGIEIAEKINNKHLVNAVSINTAVVYVDLKNYLDAKKILLHVSNLFQREEDESQIVLSLLLVNIYINLGEIDTARDLLERTEANINKSQLRIFMAEVKRYKALIYIEEARIPEAELLLYSGLSIAKEIEALDVTADIYISIGLLHKRQNELSLAKKMFLEALVICENIRSKVRILDCYKELTLLAEISEEYQEAYQYLKLHSMLTKQISDNQRNIWQSSHQVARAEREASAYKTMYDQIALISNLGNNITSNLDINIIVDKIYTGINNLLKVDVLGVALFQEDDNLLDYALFIDNGRRVNMGYFDVYDKNSIGALCVRERKEIIIDNFDIEYHKYIENDSLNNSAKRNQSMIFLPLIVGDKVIGFLTVQSSKVNEYDGTDIHTLRIFGNYAAIALENAKLFKEVQYSATHDYLTNIYNRREVINRGELLFDNKRKLSVALFDIDLFKKVNDNYGHLSGDRALKRFAKIISRNLGNHDFVGRVGGEEFLIVFVDKDEETITRTVENIRLTLQNHIFTNPDDMNFSVTCSGGICFYDEDYTKFNDYIHNADIALYQAKNSGRNQIKKAN